MQSWPLDWTATGLDAIIIKQLRNFAHQGYKIQIPSGFAQPLVHGLFVGCV